MYYNNIKTGNIFYTKNVVHFYIYTDKYTICIIYYNISIKYHEGFKTRGLFTA